MARGRLVIRSNQVEPSSVHGKSEALMVELSESRPSFSTRLLFKSGVRSPGETQCSPLRLAHRTLGRSRPWRLPPR